MAPIKHDFSSSSVDTDSLCPICGTNSTKDDWIQCDYCKFWYHNKCLKIIDSENYIKFHCHKCVPIIGESVKKRISSRKKPKIDYSALNEGSKNLNILKDSLHPHINKLVNYNKDHGVSEMDCFYQVTGKNLNKEFIFKTGFQKPIYINEDSLNGIEMLMPKGLTVSQVTDYVGEELPVEVMDVLTQDSLPGWHMKDWRDYYNNSNDRKKIRNAISLEVSNTKLNALIKRPKIVEQLDIVDLTWPKEFIEKRKSVSKYCLMSVEDSFTDFHIDFAGTQVYYNVIRGQKKFLLFPPTKYNLKQYSKWSISETQNTIFFPDFLRQSNYETIKPENEGFLITLNEGDLMLIPSGWIHAVYTPKDSVVIGGNFLTLVSMEHQLSVIQIEKTTKVPAKFSFPNFQTTMWYVAKYFLKNGISNLNELEIIGLKKLLQYLQSLLDLLTGCCFEVNDKRRVKKNLPKKYIGDPQVLIDDLKNMIDKIQCT